MRVRRLPRCGSLLTLPRHTTSNRDEIRICLAISFPAMTMPAGFATDGLPVGIASTGAPAGEL